MIEAPIVCSAATSTGPAISCEPTRRPDPRDVWGQLNDAGEFLVMIQLPLPFQVLTDSVQVRDEMTAWLRDASGNQVN